MIKYVCINSEPYHGYDSMYPSSLTMYKIYDGVEELPWVKIIDDKGFTNSYSRNRFILLSEWREQKINEILHD